MLLLWDLPRRQAIIWQGSFIESPEEGVFEAWRSKWFKLGLKLNHIAWRSSEWRWASKSPGSHSQAQLRERAFLPLALPEEASIFKAKDVHLQKRRDNTHLDDLCGVQVEGPFSEVINQGWLERKANPRLCLRHLFQEEKGQRGRVEVVEEVLLICPRYSLFKLCATGWS